MECFASSLTDVLVFSNRKFADNRGSFSELFRQADFDAHLARFGQSPLPLVQDNFSISHPNVLRGLHFQSQPAQGKLVSVLAGEIFDVAVDIRVDSPSFGHWFGTRLNAANGWQLWLPPGFAHGFYVTSAEPAYVVYKCSNYYSPENEHVVQWDDPRLAIEWPISGKPRLSCRDQQGRQFDDLF